MSSPMSSGPSSHGFNDLDMTLQLTHDDISRKEFLIAFKKRVNIAMGAEVRTLFDVKIAREIGEVQPGRKNIAKPHFT